VFFGGIFIEKQALQDEGIEYPIKLEYYKNINEDEIANHSKERYGLKIIKTEYRETDTKIEEKEINYITNDERKINKMLNLFKENTVTPVGADDVLDDLLKQEI